MKTMKKIKPVKRRRWHCVAARIRPGAVGAEVGVYKGDMSKNLFKMVPRLTLYMVDRWAVYTDSERAGSPATQMAKVSDPAYWEKIKGMAKAVAKANKGARLIMADSVEAASQIKDKSLDFVFIDGDHSYEGVRRDIRAWMPKVKPGGWLMGHDYGNKPDGGVKRAVDALKKKVVLDADHVWMVKL